MLKMLQQLFAFGHIYTLYIPLAALIALMYSQVTPVLYLDSARHFTGSKADNVCRTNRSFAVPKIIVKGTLALQYSGQEWAKTKPGFAASRFDERGC